MPKGGFEPRGFRCCPGYSVYVRSANLRFRRGLRRSSLPPLCGSIRLNPVLSDRVRWLFGGCSGSAGELASLERSRTSLMVETATSQQRLPFVSLERTRSIDATSLSPTATDQTRAFLGLHRLSRFLSISCRSGQPLGLDSPRTRCLGHSLWKPRCQYPVRRRRSRTTTKCPARFSSLHRVRPLHRSR